ncbi:MAG: transporter ATP-binding protein [Frankiales bacterium]|nr:transporter ATP-binding protein [Frankiales bacterium]
MRDALRSSFQMIALAFRHSRVRIVIALTLVLAEGFAWPGVALGLKGAVNAAVTHNTAAAAWYGAGIACGAIGVLLLHHFSYVPYAEVCDLIEVSLQAELMTLANGSARIEHHERPEYADKIAVLQRELGVFQQGMTGLLTMVSLVTSMILTGALLAGVDPWLLLLPLAAIPPVLTGQRAQRIIDASKERSASHTRQAMHLYALATRAASAKELRVSGLQDEVVRRQREEWSTATRTLWLAERRATVIGSSGQLVFAVAYVGSVLLVLREAVRGHRNVGDVVLVVTLAAQVNQQVTTGLDLLKVLQRVTQALTRLRWLRALIADQQPPKPDRAMPNEITDGIELRDVAFTYPGTDTPVLSEVNLRLPAGTTVAIVGENGAGKTTLVKLLCRFYDSTSGAITLDGTDITRFPLEDWRRRIAAGFQDFVRFEMAAQQTVGVGDLPSLDDEASVLGALGRAHAGDVVDRLDNGLQTQLGKSYADGTELSGGQWQKLALGRAMMRELPLLLILDEPTSALDAEAEHQLFEQYAENARRVGRETGAITVLVSHRFSTVRMADVILVVAGGRIAEAGDHPTLIARGGLYAELYALQAAAYE